MLLAAKLALQNFTRCPQCCTVSYQPWKCIIL